MFSGSTATPLPRYGTARIRTSLGRAHFVARVLAASNHEVVHARRLTVARTRNAVLAVEVAEKWDRSEFELRSFRSLRSLHSLVRIRGPTHRGVRWFAHASRCSPSTPRRSGTARIRTGVTGTQGPKYTRLTHGPSSNHRSVPRLSVSFATPPRSARSPRRSPTALPRAESRRGAGTPAVARGSASSPRARAASAPVRR